MRRTTTVASASAAVLCLGVLLTGCADAAGSGYAAVGAAGPSDGTAATKPAPPPGDVELTPLDGGGDGSGPSDRSGPPNSPGPAAPGPSPAPTGSSPSGAPTTSPPTTPPGPSAGTPAGHSDGDTPGSNPPSVPGGSPAPRPPSPTIPAGPGAPSGLVVGKPVLADTDVRWCQQITIAFLDTGDRPVTAGTVTFGSHVIGALGIDWATLESTRPLPLPLAPGTPATGRWRVCVDAWRVPWGMHLDTRDVTFKWK
ncbi:hypothetical protein [Streptomyces noursei]|uniref:Secreted protein n=1 Tax=Streptomyces noursei TaxID=1971 RepID=A0A2N8P5M1_STRNR|nr:hypothetical protein [Streptomyces noursei]PNE36318.1 hypothetical protein AOB60_40175 [Streptomyces noursei]